MGQVGGAWDFAEGRSVSFNPQHIGVTDHAMARFRERAHGHPKEATYVTVQRSVRSGRKMRDTDVAVFDDALYPVTRKAGFTFYVNECHQIVLVMESIENGFRVVTCLPLDMEKSCHPGIQLNIDAERLYGAEFSEWWSRNRGVPQDERRAMSLAGRAWNASRAMMRVGACGVLGEKAAGE